MQTYQKAVFAVWFLLAGMAFSVSAQPLTFKQPADYNDYIVVEQTLIGKKIEAFSEALAKEDFRSAKKLHPEVLAQVETSIRKINDLPDYKGNSEFKKAAFELFVFYKMIIESDYVKIMNIAEKKGLNDKTYGEISGIFVSVQRDEAVMYGAFNKAQQKFAEQFKMKIGENPLEKERREKNEPVPPPLEPEPRQ